MGRQTSNDRITKFFTLHRPQAVAKTRPLQQQHNNRQESDRQPSVSQERAQRQEQDMDEDQREEEESEEDEDLGFRHDGADYRHSLSPPSSRAVSSPAVSQRVISRPAASRPIPAEITVPTTIDIMINFRAGGPQTHTRARASLPEATLYSHNQNSLGFDTLMLTVRHHASSIENFSLHENNPWLQPTATATQSKFKVLNSVNCNSLISVAYVKEARRLRKEAIKSGLDPDDIHVTLNVFAYLTEKAPAAPAQGIYRRATKKRIEATLHRMSNDPTLSDMGPGQRRYMATSLARQGVTEDPTDTTPLPRPPNNATNRQLGHIDSQHFFLAQRTAEEQATKTQLFRTVPVKIAGVAIDVQINIEALRIALRLPTGIDLDAMATIIEPESNPAAPTANQQDGRRDGPAVHHQRGQTSVRQRQQQQRQPSLARVDSSEDIQDIDHASTIESDGDIDGYDSGLDY